MYIRLASFGLLGTKVLGFLGFLYGVDFLGGSMVWRYVRVDYADYSMYVVISFFFIVLGSSRGTFCFYGILAGNLV